jgi:endonuclease/exonuclease/phosphatase family metal-dependent hydrolase
LGARGSRCDYRSMTVLTFNTLFRPAARRRLGAIAPRIAATGADLVCLQEVVYRANASLLGRALNAYEPPVARRFGLWCVGGLVTLSRTPVLSWSYEVFDRRGLWMTISAADRLLRKGFLITRHRLAGLDVVLVNTHLLANYDQDWSPGNRFLAHQVDELAQLSRALAKVDRQSFLIVAGDFNVPAGNDALDRFVSENGLTSVFGQAAPPATLRPGKGVQTLAIDHILYRAPADVRVEAAATTAFAEAIELAPGVTGFASDHLAVTATLNL